MKAVALASGRWLACLVGIVPTCGCVAAVRETASYGVSRPAVGATIVVSEATLPSEPKVLVLPGG